MRDFRLCSCGHPYSKHLSISGRCLAPDSYGILCECPSPEPIEVSSPGPEEDSGGH